MAVSGFEWFVAWRHLRDPERRSRRALLTGLVLIVLGIAALAAVHWLSLRAAPRGFLPARPPLLAGQIKLGGSVALALGLIVTYLGVLLRAFTVFTAISVFGVFLGTAAPIIALSVMSGFEADLKGKIRGAKADVVITRADGDKPFTDWQKVQERLAGLSGLVASTPYVEAEVMLKAGNTPAAVVLRGVDPASGARVFELGRIEGRLADLDHPERVAVAAAELERVERVERLTPSPNPEAQTPGAAPNNDPRRAPKGGAERAPEERDGRTAPPPLDVLPTILLGEELYAGMMRVFIGSEVLVVCPMCGMGLTGPGPRPKRFRVAGHFKTGMYEYDARSVYVSLAVAQEYLKMEGEVTGIDLRTADPDQAGPVAEAAARLLGPEYLVRSWQELNRNLFMALRLEKIAMFIVLTFIALVASFSIVANLIMLVTEKGREVAILKTMGATDRAILRIFFAEGLYIGLLGLLAGVGAGVLVCGLMETYGLPLPAEIYYMDKLPVVMRSEEIATVAALVLMLCCLATIYPAWLASRMRPVEGLRYE